MTTPRFFVSPKGDVLYRELVHGEWNVEDKETAHWIKVDPPTGKAREGLTELTEVESRTVRTYN